MSGPELASVVAAVVAGVVIGCTVPRRLGVLASLPLAGVFTAGGVLSACLAGARPVGVDAVDVPLSGAFAAVLAVAASRAGFLPLLGACAVATMGASPPTAHIGSLAVGLLLGTEARRPTTRCVACDALVGALVANVALRMTWPTVSGGTAALAAVVAAMIAVPALRRSSRHARRVSLGSTVVLVAFSLGVSLASVASLALARGDLDRALRLADDGLLLAREGDDEAAAEAFEAAEQHLARVPVARWPTRLARLVPGVGQNVAALREGVDAARAVLKAGAEVAAEVDLDRVQPVDGRVDVDALASFAAPLRRTAEVLDRSASDIALLRADDVWVVGPLDRRLGDLAARISRVRADNAAALEASTAVPALLGNDAERRWFVAVMTPSELRGGGGLVGNWGLLTATDGRLELPVFERIRTLFRPEPYAFDVSPEWNARYIERFGLARNPQNILASPHFPDSAAAIRQLAEQAGIGPIDGVIALDPFGLAGLLELTGPITVPGWPEPITSSNAAEILLFRQYERALDPARIDFLAAVTRELFDKLTTGRLPGPARIVDVLAPLVAERRIQLVAFDDAAADYLSRLRADSALPVPSVDALGLVTQNAAPSKLDWFLRRELRYELTVGADGESRGSIEVALRNEAPSGGLGPYFQDLQQRFPPGHNRQLVSIYSRLEATRVTVDGRRVDVVHTTERGRRVVAFFAEIPPGATTRIRVEVAGTLPVAGGRYAIRVDHQPTVAPDSIEVVLNGRTLVDGALRTPIDTIRRL